MRKYSSMFEHFKKAGTRGNARIVMAAAEGIVKATDRILLVEHGGHIQLTQAWAYSILKRMDFIRRKATTKSKLTLSESTFKQCKANYLQKIKKVVRDGKIPLQLSIMVFRSSF